MATLQAVLLSAIGTILTALITWGTERLIAFLNTKIKNVEYQRMVQEASNLVLDSVKSTYQTYVEALKDKDMFTANAQINALNMAKDSVLQTMPLKMQQYIENNFGDVGVWVTQKIESSLYDLKN